MRPAREGMAEARQHAPPPAVMPPVDAPGASAAQTWVPAGPTKGCGRSHPERCSATHRRVERTAAIQKHFDEDGKYCVRRPRSPTGAAGDVDARSPVFEAERLRSRGWHPAPCSGGDRAPQAGASDHVRQTVSAPPQSRQGERPSCVRCAVARPYAICQRRGPRKGQRPGIQGTPLWAAAARMPSDLKAEHIGVLPATKRASHRTPRDRAEYRGDTPPSGETVLSFCWA